jgi:tagatose 1,6-diphosphate aldolase
VGGLRTAAGAEAEVAYSRQEARTHLRDAASAASKPLIYLSGGCTDETFREMLELAAEAGVKYVGVLCGRATWQDAIPIYAYEGVAALKDWLAERGAQNVQALNNVLAHSATPWWDIYGGKDNIELVAPGTTLH